MHIPGFNQQGKFLLPAIIILLLIGARIILADEPTGAWQLAY